MCARLRSSLRAAAHPRTTPAAEPHPRMLPPSPAPPQPRTMPPPPRKSPAPVYAVLAAHDAALMPVRQHNFSGMAPDVQHYASQNPQGNTSLVGNDDESEWLLRCDAYTYISVVCQEHNGGRSRGLYMPVRCWIIITSLSDDDSRRGVAN